MNQIFHSSSLKAGLALTLCLSIGGAMAQGRVCSQADSTAADAAIEAIPADRKADPKKVWPALHAFFGRYRQCDDGGIGEGISDTVANLLARKWSASAPIVAGLNAQDPAFGAFVIKHIDSTAAPDRLKAIQKAATAHCPSGQQAFCAEVAKATTRALADT